MRERLRDGRGEDGFTLIELLVSMAVFGLALGMVYSALVQALTYANKVQGSADANFELRQAVTQIDRQVRSGNVLYSPANETVPSTCTASGTDAGSCMRVYTQSNGSQRCVQWQVLPDPAGGPNYVLRSRNWSPTWQTDNNLTGWTVQARNLAPSPAQAPFALAGAATSYSARYLTVRFEAVDPRRTGTAVITSSVSGRNTNYGYDGGLCSPIPPG